MSIESLPESCDVDGSADDDSSVDGQVFVGNTVLVVGILFAIFFFHVAIISAVEAYWLAQVRSIQTCAKPSDRCFILIFSKHPLRDRYIRRDPESISSQL